MLKTLSTMAALAASLAIPVTAAAQGSDTRIFKPSGQWVMDYGDDYCRLARNFSDGEKELALAFERIQPGAMLRLVMVGGDMKLYRRATELGYGYLPGGSDRKAPLLRSETAGGDQYLNLGWIMIGPPPAPPASDGPPLLYSREQEQAFASGITGLHFEEGLITPVDVETGSMKAPVAAMQTCTDELLTVWGLDAEKHRSLTRVVIPDGDLSGWLPQGTIGFGDFGKIAGGANAIRLMVDAEGKPTSCAIHWPSLTEGKNQQICDALVSNASFLPALDADGAAMASYWTIDPIWLLPGPGRR